MKLKGLLLAAILAVLVGTGVANANTVTPNGVAPTGSPTFTGTVTMPDLSTWNSSGLTALAGVSIGAPTGGMIGGSMNVPQAFTLRMNNQGAITFPAGSEMRLGSGLGTVSLGGGQTFNFNSDTITGLTGLPVTGGGIISTTGGVAPTLTAGCNGAGSSFLAGSTNNRGQFTTQTAAATTCTITWSASATWPQAPFCVFSGNLQAIVPPASPGTATYIITFTATSAAVVENYVCM